MANEPKKRQKCPHCNCIIGKEEHTVTSAPPHGPCPEA